jgi:hypothetical protein
LSSAAGVGYRSRRQKPVFRSRPTSPVEATQLVALEVGEVPVLVRLSVHVPEPHGQRVAASADDLPRAHPSSLAPADDDELARPEVVDGRPEHEQEPAVALDDRERVRRLLVEIR